MRLSQQYILPVDCVVIKWNGDPYDEDLSHILRSGYEILYNVHARLNSVYMLPIERHPHRAQQQSRILIIRSSSADNDMNCRYHPRRISII